MTADYSTTAPDYLSSGWLPFPLPPGEKSPPPRGVTGRIGTPPSGPDVYEWCEQVPAGSNLGVLLTPDVIGIDVDHYGDKTGAATLVEHIQQWGPLPPTVRSSARDWPSGIWFYRVPPGLAFPERLGPAVELIRSTHRYAVVWPSIHPSGAVYRWHEPFGTDGEDVVLAEGVIPRVAELAELPAAWVEGLTGGRLDAEAATEAVGGEEAAAWLSEHDESGACPRVAGATQKIVSAIRGGTAHDSLSGLLGLARLAEHHHRGVGPAVAEVAAAFNFVAVNHGRAPDEARSEFSRSWRGAVGKVLATAEVFTPQAPCDCGLDPDDLVDRTPPDPPSSSDPSGDDLDSLLEDSDDSDSSSWAPVDLGPVLDGTVTTPPPTVLRRSDDQPLFYSGRVNGLIGESESGKTWVALAAVAQELDAGHHVLYLDPEDSAPGFVDRMRALGATDEQLSAQVVYINPDEPLRGEAVAAFRAIVGARPWSMICVDGVNAMMSLFGFDITDNNDATKFSQAFLTPLTKCQAAVVVIDHLPKNNAESKGGIGAQAKRAMMTGCSMRVAVTAEFGRGLTGKLALTVDKDRPGYVRGVSAFAKRVGTAVLASDGTKMVITIEAPDQRPASEKGSWRPTAVMARVSQWLAGRSDQGWSRQQVCQGVGGRKEVVRAALDALVESGHVSAEPGARGSIQHRHVARYSELDDLVDADNEDEEA